MESKDGSSGEGDASVDFKLMGSDYKLQEAPSAKEVAISGGYEQVYVILKSDSPTDVKVSFEEISFSQLKTFDRTQFLSIPASCSYSYSCIEPCKISLPQHYNWKPAAAVIILSAPIDDRMSYY